MFGVFKWEKAGMYKPKDAIRTFKSEKLAQKYADRENEKDSSKNLVVRTIREDTMGAANKLVESMIDDGREPADIFRSLVYGEDFQHPFQPLNEDTGGDVSIPEVPGVDTPSEFDTLNGNEISVSVADSDDKALFAELITALDTAGVNYEVKDTNADDDEVGGDASMKVISWEDDDADAVSAAFLGLGMKMADADTGEPEPDYSGSESVEEAHEEIQAAVIMTALRNHFPKGVKRSQIAEALEMLIDQGFMKRGDLAMFFRYGQILRQALNTASQQQGTGNTW